ncbi:HAMP domain-containing protein [Rheinheimera sp. UJ51]|uniref:ATP-binding protein n=1 Tax=Rheinheimera sp. UJ51 TaxID=2892446 RepID=UPI001E42B467|nr:ATP-binding protein [Rheinheimera sp. UJ51]MCC5450594.1 HAMP domain-containing protein [Rheinheimera sp. UJ51]
MKIQNKLLLTLLGLSLFIISSLAMFAQWSFGQGLIKYVNSKEKELLQPFVEELQQSYQKQQSWEQWAGQPRYFFDRASFYLQAELSPRGFAQRQRPQSGPHEPRAGRPPPPPPEKRGPAIALLDSAEQLVVGSYDASIDYHYFPIWLQQQQIGTLLVAKKEQLSQDYEFEILQQQQHYWLWVGLFLFVVVVVISNMIARHFVQPIKKVVEGMTQLTRGNYEQKIEINRKDELQLLSQHFNTLAQRLSQTETHRKRWLATVSHELRTPIAILKGETEALIDGIRQPDLKNLQSIHSEVNQLSKMIDDLYALTSQQIEGIPVKLQQHDLLAFLQQHQLKYSQYLQDNAIQLLTDWPSGTLWLAFDPVRLNQLFENILTNCVKYAQASQFTLSVRQHDQQVLIQLADNGIGIAPQHHAHIFEYLYRAEEHRHRSNGGLGLGLALCAQIVHRHHGDIFASTAAQGGLAISIVLPLKLPENS